MVSKFEKVMAKLAILGHSAHDLVDCSEVIPVPSKAKAQSAKLPAGKTIKDIQHAVSVLRHAMHHHDLLVLQVCRHAIPGHICRPR